MRSLIIVPLTFAAVAHASAQQKQDPPPRMAASSFVTTEVHVDQRKIEGKWFAEDASLTGPAKISISYGQPHARGRKIEGGLIPLDTVWRFGANMAATLHTDQNLTIGGTAVPHGDYALFLLYSKTGWQLIVNRETGHWGTEYDKSQDLARVPLAATPRAEREESFTVYLVPESGRPRSGYAEMKGTLRIVWGNTELITGWTVPM